MNEMIDYNARWTSMERELTVIDRLRLVEIAHETREPQVRKWALDTLERASIPPVMIRTIPPRMVRDGYGGMRPANGPADNGGFVPL